MENHSGKTGVVVIYDNHILRLPLKVAKQSSKS
jgi:hypothetical protein